MNRFITKIVLCIGIGKSQILPELYVINAPVKQDAKTVKIDFKPKYFVNKNSWSNNRVFKRKRNVQLQKSKGVE